MCLEVVQLHVRAGDRRRKFKTDTPKEREDVARLIAEKLRDGAAIFVQVNGDDFRVQGYDKEQDELVVLKNRVTRGQRSSFNIPANGASIKIVPPVAGG